MKSYSTKKGYMFTGIIKGLFKIINIEYIGNILRITIAFSIELAKNLEIGASVAVNGTCLTVTAINNGDISFDIIEETLKRTNLKNIKSGDFVHIERAAKWGDEIGGHLLSGHVFDVIAVTKIIQNAKSKTFIFSCPLHLIKYLFPKGFVALDGVSLTVGDVDRLSQFFSVHLIPETLSKTNFDTKRVGDLINIEIDAQTQIIVDTLERLHTNAE